MEKKIEREMETIIEVRTVAFVIRYLERNSQGSLRVIPPPILKARTAPNIK